ncbi:putative RNA recognition motif domain, nucleotide-binding alpha-beta plait domain superfamily [Helianthus annuus]|nr:putative RNA recognition motif domain, nucleotide-binding alpha-beta plait domain superfamily [Helianthus annuus]
MGGGQQEVTKFFVTNLQEGCSSWDLRQGLEGYGAISGTYIAKKRDKFGNRFGFVSFVDVKDRSELEKSLRGAKLGDTKLKITIARFAVENSEFSGLQEGNSSNRFAPFQGDRSKLFSLRDVRSYSDVLGKSKAAEEAKMGPKVVNRDDHGKVLIVPDMLEALKDLFGVAVYNRIQYIGGLFILISFGEVGSANRFLESRELWGPWFSKLEAWKGQTLPLERVAWLNLHGIPIHLLDESVFMQVGEVFGKVLHFPKSLDDVLDLSFVTVGVLAGEAGRISEPVTLSWKGRSFRVWVEEEHEAWVPGCLGCDSGGSPANMSGSLVMSSPIGNVGIKESQQVGGDGDLEKSPGLDDVPSHADLGNLQKERENGGLGVDPRHVEGQQPVIQPVGPSISVFGDGPFINPFNVG